MLTKLDTRTANIVHQDIVQTLKEVEERYGIKIMQHGGTINSDTEVVLKLLIRVTDEDSVRQQERKEFNLYCHLYDLQPEDYLKRIVLNGKEMEIMGFAAKRSKYPYKFRDPKTGKVTLYTETVVSRVRAAQKVAA